MMKPAVIALGALVAMQAAPAFAQSALPGDPAALFISPCGKPYRSEPGEPYPVAAWFTAVDTNQDKAIDKEELRVEASGFFKELDRNENGLIDPDEMTYYERVTIPEIGASQLGTLDGQAFLFQAQLNQPDLSIVPGGDQSDNRPRSRGYKPLVTGAAAFNLLGDAQPVAGADTDLNSRITLAEFRAASDRRFARLDRNGDGKLTMDELPQTMVQKMFKTDRRKKRS